jgi:hypothetical protein
VDDILRFIARNSIDPHSGEDELLCCAELDQEEMDAFFLRAILGGAKRAQEDHNTDAFL